MADARGMTLIEILVVLGMTLALIALTGMADTDALRSAHARDDQRTALNALLLARTRAQSMRCTQDSCVRGSAHGVHFDPDAITVFEGATYEERVRAADLEFRRVSTVPFQEAREFVFERGSGTSVATGTVEFGAERRYGVSVDAAGRITSYIREP